MSKEKRDDAVQQQHAHEGIQPRDLTQPDSNVSFPADGELRSTDIEKRRQAFFDDYQEREAADFERARDIAQTRLDRLSENGFSDSRGGLDFASTADAIPAHLVHDHYAHLKESAPSSSNEHARSHEIKSKEDK